MRCDSGPQRQYALLESIFGKFHYHVISLDQFGILYTKYATFYILKMFFLCIQYARSFHSTRMKGSMMEEYYYSSYKS